MPWYTDGIRSAVFGVRWYVCGIRMVYGLYRWYTDGIRVVCGGVIRMVYGWRFSVNGCMCTNSKPCMPTGHFASCSRTSHATSRFKKNKHIYRFNHISWMQADAHRLSSRYKKSENKKQDEKQLTGTYKNLHFQQGLLTFVTFCNFV